MRLEAAGLGLGSAEKQRERAALIVESARLQGEIARTTEEQASLRTKMAGFTVRAAEAELRSVYRESLLHGINPQASSEAEGKEFSERVLSLGCLLTGELDPQDEAKRYLVKRIASDLVGMIQWAELLRLRRKDGEPGPATPSDAYRTVMETLASGLPLYLKDAEPRTNMAGRLHSLSNALDRLYADQAGDQAKVEIPPQPIDLKVDVRWIGVRPDRELDLLFLDLQPSLRRQVLGQFTIRFSTSRTSVKPIDVIEYVPPGDADQFAYFVDANALYMSGRYRNISFLPIFPNTTLAQNGWMVGSEPSMASSGSERRALQSQPKSLVRDSGVENLRKSIERDYDLWKRLRFVGGLGEWTFLIMGNGVKDESVRRTVIEHVRTQNLAVDLGYPFLQVQVAPVR